MINPPKNNPADLLADFDPAWSRPVALDAGGVDPDFDETTFSLADEVNDWVRDLMRSA